ncbi:DUF3293 domain-containing protein [Pseudoxanthomonas sp. 10H]|uniref:DUF3293 domain-containing protein n=1 Tax=Pseudoxanthomonas sp. 10H TaxID=3242729 RepID=UPI0035566395
MAHEGLSRAAPATGVLLRAYLAARYRVHLGHGEWLALVVGRPAPAELARTFPAASGSPLTLVTGWNPQSRPQPAASNLAADAALRAELDALHRPVLRTTSGDVDGHWEEPGWLVAGLDTATADRLARRYGQAGLLHWRPGDPVRLRMYRTPPSGAAADADARWVDWVLETPAR